MKYYTEETHDIPISYEVDVLVVGSGPAGIGAAIRAGRLGAKTMIIETQGCLGGISTAGMMSHWGGISSSKVYKEILQRGAACNENLGEAQFANKITNAINHEKLKLLMFDLLKEANVEVLLYTFACDSVVKKGKIIGVIIENKTGRSMISAKAVIDATGDGDIAAKSGVPFTLGRETDNKMQPCTHMFKLGGVDVANAVFPGSFETQVQTEKGELQTLAKELLPFPAGHVLLYTTTLPGIVCCNMTNCIEIDGTKAEDLTKGTYVCYSQMDKIVKFLQEYVPGYSECFIVSAASLLGIRETRHFKGKYRIDTDDILEAKFHDDWVVREAFFNFDVHNLTGPSLDKTGVQHGWNQKGTYTIPYGCLLPENVEGLLLSGRNISGSHMAHSNFRIMTVCMAIGEAAGAAAFLSSKSNRKLSEIQASEIQQLVS